MKNDGKHALNDEYTERHKIKERMAIMTGINFNPQSMNTSKAKSKESCNQRPPQTGDINDFLNTKEGQALVETLKKNLANKLEPANNGTVKDQIGNSQQPPKSSWSA